jgi:MoaA/NifB/PqqE/SkfB family radical SAM enzyme
MDIRKLRGSMTLSDFAEGISYKKSLGHLWEEEVDCNHCPYKTQCNQIHAQIEAEYGVGPYCRQIINFLLGESTIEDILKEAT